jgi:prephenate dehydrogenase
MAIFSKAGIVGTGLVGGSLGLALKKNKLADQVVGTSRHASSISAAKKIKAIDTGSQDINIIKGCDLVILAGPVETILGQMGRISRLVTDDCIVIDVASTKELVVKKANKCFARFVGCHPLAGSDKRGIAFARPDLFNKAACIITPVRSTDKAALTLIMNMWMKLGSDTITLDPGAHDRILAWMSHLPHAMAFALISAVPDKYLAYAPQSFRDITRIAGSGPDIWNDIFITNRKNLLDSIDMFVMHMEKIRSAIKRNDRRSLKLLIKAAQHKRLKSL